MLVKLTPLLIVFLSLSVIYRIIRFSAKQNRTFRELSRELVPLFLSIYLLMLIEVTLSPLALGVDNRIGYNLLPLRTVFRMAKYSKPIVFLKNIGGNLFLFIPYGLLVPLAWKQLNCFRNIVFSGFLTSLTIEILQLTGFFYRREVDIDDIILNVGGTIAGYAILKLLKNQLSKRAKR